MTESRSSHNNIADRLVSPDEETRRLAVAELASLRLSDSCEYLFQAMADTSWRVRKEAVSVLLSASDAADYAPGVIALLRCAENAGLRNAAAEVLERIGKSVLPLLHSSLSDSDVDVRKFIIDILGGIGDVESTPYLLGTLSDADSNVRSASAESLGKIGSRDAVEQLLAGLSIDDVSFRYTILIALARIAAPVPPEAITPFCNEPFLQRAVFECLGATGDSSACGVVLSGLQEQSKSVREASIRALITLDQRFAPSGIVSACGNQLRNLAGTSVIAGMLELLATADTDVQAGLIKLLGVIGDARAATAILRSCRNEQLVPQCIQALRELQAVDDTFFSQEYDGADDAERATILRMCGEIESCDLERLARRGLADSSPQVREAALRVVGARGLTRLLDDCAGLLSDFDFDVRYLALDTLSQLAVHDATAIGALACRLVAGGVAQRRDAACLFAAVADRQHLAQLLKDEDDQVRRSAVRGIAALGGDDVVHLLSLACTDEIADVRLAAVAALGETARQDAVDPLLLALADTDLWVRCAALRSLGTLGSLTALPAIRQVLAEDNELVVIAALEALGQFSPELSRELIRMATQSKNDDVVRVALDILVGWDDPWLDDHVEHLLMHRSWNVRIAAVQIIAHFRGPAAVPLLRLALERERDDLVRTRIVEYLERFQC